MSYARLDGRQARFRLDGSRSAPRDRTQGGQGRARAGPRPYLHERRSARGGLQGWPRGSSQQTEQRGIYMTFGATTQAIRSTDAKPMADRLWVHPDNPAEK